MNSCALISSHAFHQDGWGLREGRWVPRTVTDDEILVLQVFVDIEDIDKDLKLQTDSPMSL